MILFLSFLLLVVAPALLLWMGRFIAAIRIRDRAAVLAAEREVEQASAGAWYRRSMLPAFAAQALCPGPAGRLIPATVHDEDEREWYLRPMRPLIDWPKLRRAFWRRRLRDSAAGSGGLT